MEALSPRPTLPLVEGEDYYLEHGLLVLTAAWHRRRGQCCGNACRHCPFVGTPAEHPARAARAAAREP
ncbi:MAG: hypothetical protein IT204_03400 [Fimbriimonadaceae bacterium]|nr:hypothetical protein [Fimbriimonadaceae bacterium]